MNELVVDDHPLLDLGVLVAAAPTCLRDMATSAALSQLLRPEAIGRFASDDEVRAAIRDLLRHGGFKPTGRSKPASEYLLRAAADGKLGAINPAVDAGNAVSRFSGIPISVVDLDRTLPPLRVGIALEGASYVFNRAGQVIDVGKLLGLIDADGPCANAVKDAQRTKTDDSSRRLLMLLWGTSALPGRTAGATDWARELLVSEGFTVE